MTTAPQAKQAQRTQRLESLRQSGAPIAGRCGWISANGVQCTRKDAHFGGHSCEQAHTPTRRDRLVATPSHVEPDAQAGALLPCGTREIADGSAATLELNVPSVKALVESHDALVAALREMADAAKIQSDALLEQGLLGSPLLGAAMIKARAVLAKVDGA